MRRVPTKLNLFFRIWRSLWLILLVPFVPGWLPAQVDSPLAELISNHCISCHDSEKQKGKLDLESLMQADMAEHLEAWQEVAWMLDAREMPPEDEPRPSEAEYSAAADWLNHTLRVQEQQPTEPLPKALVLTSINTYCISCHNQDEHQGDLNLDLIVSEEVAQHPEIWEKVITRLQSRQMPPPDRRRPDEETYTTIIDHLTTTLDALALSNPNPGRVETFRRLTRTEYRNAIRDLLSVDIDVETLLPKDEESHGFDNITVGTLSPYSLDRYISAAQKISRLAVGTPTTQPEGYTYRIPADFTQEKHIDGLPLGTRGGSLFSYTFPQDGEYEFEIVLSRDRNEHVEGLNGSHEMEILLERELIGRFEISRPKGNQDHSTVDAHLKTKTFVPAGPREVGVTFIQESTSLLEDKRQPSEAHFNLFRHPRLGPAVYQITITGPIEPLGIGMTPSREKIFINRPNNSEEEEPVAHEVIGNLMKSAFRRPITDGDLEKPMSFYQDGAQEGGFEAGIENALSAILVSPEFLFRVEREPEHAPPGAVYRISDIELASRLSFFIWSSLPDQELLDLAIEGKLNEPDILETQVVRMLADKRSESLITNFASQWLHLRNLDAVTPDLRLYPDFDDNLREAFRTETQLFVESIFREDRSLLELLKSDYTFLNERLARHYGITGILGSRFRRVPLEPQHHRGGLLRQGSILTVTSYATRTSPVIRGNWVLENIIGTPPPPPPPDIPALEENTVDMNLSIRDRLAEHRANPACASCHNLMDPIGFSLENFDAVGRWRDFEYGDLIDAVGGLPDGSEFAGIGELENGLLKRPELFVKTLTSKLLTFALGRGIEASDAPAIRKIIQESQHDHYRFSSVILGITKSVPFQMRKASEAEPPEN